MSLLHTAIHVPASFHAPLPKLLLEKHGRVGTHLRTDREIPKGEC
jgi:hypothetical protein